MTVFRDDQDYLFYTDLLREQVEENQMAIHHYCLMPNHVHLMIGQGEPQTPTFMQRLQQRYSLYFRRRYGYHGHVWQKRYFSNVIKVDQYLLACGSYIELNPVRAGLATKPEQWKYSTSRHYSLGENISFVKDNPLFLQLNALATHGRQRLYAVLIDQLLEERWVPSSLINKS